MSLGRIPEGRSKNNTITVIDIIFLVALMYLIYKPLSLLL